jgi:hypothetical protein
MRIRGAGASTISKEDICRNQTKSLTHQMSRQSLSTSVGIQLRRRHCYGFTGIAANLGNLDGVERSECPERGEVPVRVMGSNEADRP